MKLDPWGIPFDKPRDIWEEENHDQMSGLNSLGRKRALNDNSYIERGNGKQLEYHANSKGQWPCPGGYCSHYDCIMRYETSFNTGKRYFIGKETH